MIFLEMQSKHEGNDTHILSKQFHVVVQSCLNHFPNILRVTFSILASNCCLSGLTEFSVIMGRPVAVLLYTTTPSSMNFSEEIFSLRIVSFRVVPCRKDSRYINAKAAFVHWSPRLSFYWATTRMFRYTFFVLWIVEVSEHVQADPSRFLYSSLF